MLKRLLILMMLAAAIAAATYTLLEDVEPIEHYYEEKTFTDEAPPHITEKVETENMTLPALSAENCFEDEVYDETDQMCYLALEPEDCFDDEEYDAETKSCYLACEEGEDCENASNSLLDFLSRIGDDFYEEGQSYTNLDPSEESILASYTISGDTITRQELPDVAEELVPIQAETDKHEALWLIFTQLVPPSQRTDFVQFDVITDGEEGTLAAVYQSKTDPEQWVLAVDITDAYPEGALDREDLTYSLIHEFGHVLTLNARQVTVDEALFNAADAEAEVYDILYENQAQKCTQYFTTEGCSEPASYLNQFYQRFWVDLFDEHEALQYIEDDTEYEDALIAFYDDHSDQFVTDYAATNPGEDIAESWTAFVLQDRPEGNSNAEQKIDFFYTYPNLVKLRDLIRLRAGR